MKIREKKRTKNSRTKKFIFERFLLALNRRKFHSMCFPSLILKWEIFLQQKYLHVVEFVINVLTGKKCAFCVFCISETMRKPTDLTYLPDVTIFIKNSNIVRVG